MNTVAALKGLMEKYRALVNSGDCGHWDVEKEPEIIAARAAIAEAEGQKSYQIGDVVSLRSGGVAMTVEAIDSHSVAVPVGMEIYGDWPTPTIYCVWINSYVQLERNKFTIPVLMSE